MTSAKKEALLRIKNRNWNACVSTKDAITDHSNVPKVDFVNIVELMGGQLQKRRPYLTEGGGVICLDSSINTALGIHYLRF